MGEYVGGEEDSEPGCYMFRFGMGATARTERMYLALMQGFDGITADVFRDRAEAARFLAVAPETLRVP